MHPVIHWPANQDQQENYLLILTISKGVLEDFRYLQHFQSNALP